MTLNTLPRKIWSVYSGATRKGLFTTRVDARNFKQSLVDSGSNNVHVFSQTFDLGALVQDSKS